MDSIKLWMRLSSRGIMNSQGIKRERSASAVRISRYPFTKPQIILRCTFSSGLLNIGFTSCCTNKEITEPELYTNVGRWQLNCPLLIRISVQSKPGSWNYNCTLYKYLLHWMIAPKTITLAQKHSSSANPHGKGQIRATSAESLKSNFAALLINPLALVLSQF